MTPAGNEHAVSVVIPSLDDFDLFEANLPPLLDELSRRAAGDEVLLVDDTGTGAIEKWLVARGDVLRAGGTASVDLRAVSRESNGGFAAAVASGVAASRREFLCVLNPDVRVRTGFLAPLVRGLDDPRVFACVPRVLLNGREGWVESLMQLEWKESRLRVREFGALYGDVVPSSPTPVPFAIGGAMCTRKERFVARGFDPLYEPFYWEDVDLGWRAWRDGERVLFQPDSVVEHHHRGTIGRSVPPDIVRAAIDRNTYLFTWKFLDDPKLAREHVAALYETVLERIAEGRAAELSGLALALDDLSRAMERRGALPAATKRFGEILDASSRTPPA